MEPGPYRLEGDFTQKPVGEELYTHKGDTGADMNSFENKNLASDTAYASVRRDMYNLAVEHWNTQQQREGDRQGSRPSTNEKRHLPEARSPRSNTAATAARQLQYEMWNEE